MRDLARADALGPPAAGTAATARAIALDAATLARNFDREPFGFEHGLSGLDLFGESALRELVQRYDRDFFVAAGAETAATPFYSVANGRYTPAEAFERLDSGNHRILLKMPETYDSRYRDLLESLFADVVALHDGLRGQRIVRLASSVLISSMAAITPFHFDPESSFFFQIAGEKIYHLYRPSVLSERELERFYVMGTVNVGQVELAGRDPGSESTFRLVAGMGLHQPHNCPHWVETRQTRSISYVFSFETEASRALGRTRAFNHYLRACGLEPSLPGQRPQTDARKARAMQIFIPLRKRAGRALRSVLRRP